MFKYKQSSDSFVRNVFSLLMYICRPFEGGFSFFMVGKDCGHTGVKRVAILVPDHGGALTVTK